ncbi:MAG TPA: class I SAM-dependent methyltransferase [Dehalococcoidia bacterium]|nr:class I SAM-dependent methyltransferase [Dehalococcoidia bacterium]
MNQASNYKAYDIDYHITEIYDQIETQTEDISLIKDLIGVNRSLRILEPFCGNGWILVPLAQDGHEIVGIDKSAPMLESARDKIRKLPQNVRNNIILHQANVLTHEWPQDFDLVILGGNCLYELATPEEQEKCVSLARNTLKANGYLYLDNNHMEGDLNPEWRKSAILENTFPTGVCSDGTQVRVTTQTIWYDAENRLTRSRRTVEIITPNGNTLKKEWIEGCHAPSTFEMKAWLSKYGFNIENIWGDRNKSPYTDDSPQAVFWAKLVKKLGTA